MSAASKRGDRAEETAAKLLGGERLGGRRKREPVPDGLTRICGVACAIESKSRLSLPRFLVRALEQARKRAPLCEPLVFLRERGQKGGLIVLDAERFAELVGVRDPAAGEQLALAMAVEEPARPRRRGTHGGSAAGG